VGKFGVFGKGVNAALGLAGYQVVRREATELDVPLLTSQQDQQIIRSVRPDTMLSNAQLAFLLRGISHLTSHQIPGDIVECGVWRGGASALMARKLFELSETHRNIWLYDTFVGMTEPSTEDHSFLYRESAEALLASNSKSSHVWAVSSRAHVAQVMKRSQYPEERIRLVEGDVCQTLMEQKPTKIALLRLDTDWYESTKIELHELVPLLSPGAIVTIDDYGYWAGSRQATEEYFLANPPRPLIEFIDRYAVWFHT
jgi:predicted O-methyltransferase YrrM